MRAIADSPAEKKNKQHVGLKLTQAGYHPERDNERVLKKQSFS
jgi:hypothetical protein